MKAYKTAAFEADKELTDILGYEGRLYKEGLADYHTIIPIRLATTYDEAMLILYERVIVRPAFKIKEKTVQYPCLFIKLDGNNSDFMKTAHKWKQEHVKTTLLYSGFHMIDRQPTTASLLQSQQLQDDFNSLNKIENLSYLTPVKRKHLIDSYLKVKIWLEEMTITLTSKELIASLLLDNKIVIDAYQMSSPLVSPPKCIINDSQKKSLSHYAIVRLLMMHALGFDIVITSKQKYASIENIIPNDFYDRHVLEYENKAVEKNTFKLSILAKFILGGGVLVAILLKIFNVI